MERIVGPYTGRALTPLATVDLVGWDVHKAIVDNVYAHTKDEAHDDASDARLHGRARGRRASSATRAGGGFFAKEDGKDRLVLDPAQRRVPPARPASTAPTSATSTTVARSYAQGRYAEGDAPRSWLPTARRPIDRPQGRRRLHQLRLRPRRRGRRVHHRHRPHHGRRLQLGAAERARRRHGRRRRRGADRAAHARPCPRRLRDAASAPDAPHRSSSIPR